MIRQLLINRQPGSFDHNCCQQALLQFDRPTAIWAAEPVVHRLLKILLAAEVAFGGEHGCVSQQKVGSVRFRRRLNDTVSHRFYEDHAEPDDPFECVRHTSETTYRMTFSEIPFPQGPP